MKLLTIILFSFLFLATYSQDTTYARTIIKKLCSKELLGRGYVNDGVNKAAAYISNELKIAGLSKFGKSYSQTYEFPVNTFPGVMSVVLDGKPLVAGKHYLIEPSSKTIKMGFQLFKTDSVTYEANDGRRPFPLQVKLKKKLTYTVATKLSDNTVIDLLKDSFPNELKNIDVIFENKFIPHFKCQNLCGYVKGTQHPDSFIVFTAHYDHLGAMGKDTYFPGANDKGKVF